MLPPRHAIGRIPGARRSLKPPSHGAPHQLRLFTNRPRLLIISSPQSRPQLPFLSPSTGARPLPPLSIHLRQHFGRLISTEAREKYKRQLSGGVRITVTVYVIIVSFAVLNTCMYQDELEKKFPTPTEFSWGSRWELRCMLGYLSPESIGLLVTDWPAVAGYARSLLEKLEDVEKEGKGIVEQVDGGVLVEGVGNGGFDITDKEEPWRRGYFQALMGGAKAAENLEGWVRDTKTDAAAPVECMVGPSNPRPKPMPRSLDRPGPKPQRIGPDVAPKEEDCVPASPGPETFYLKILTTNGFDTGQKLDAALGYAEWLNYKGLQDTSRDMYKWAMDLATEGSSVDAAKVVDVKTGVLKNNGTDLPSENVLRVSTALAVYQAQHGNLPTALSAFTSILKARRALPPSENTTPPAPTEPPNPITQFQNKLRTILIPGDYPPPPPSGNDPPLRTPSAICEEAALMNYIGEILFATSPSGAETGLAWTRDAVDTAESSISALGGKTHITPQHRCSECLRVGLGNWRQMVKNLLSKAETAEQDAAERAKTAWVGGQRRLEKRSLEKKRLRAELEILEDRAKTLAPFIDVLSGLDIYAPGITAFL